MPLISRWLIRLSFLYLLAGSTIGALLLINKALSFSTILWLLLPVHIEFMIFGWIIQLTIGVAYWILPRFLGSHPRGNKYLASGMVICYNAGIWLITLSNTEVTTPELSIAGRCAELTAIFIFIFLHWGRIVSYNRN